MGGIRTYPPVKMIAAITFAPSAPREEILGRLAGLFSDIDRATPEFDFTFTDYYTPEMGAGLRKQMVSFSKLEKAERLPEFKIATNQLEEKYVAPTGRVVNIDPGYICAARLVLATTKDYDHRVYLGQGIFGDVHLRFREKKFHPNQWTYPDYRQPHILQFFEQVRGDYMTQLAGWEGAGH